MYGRFAGPKKVTIIARWPYYRGGRKAGFHCTIESFSFQDENDYEYEIFSIVSSACAWGSVILAGKRGSPRHSTTSFSECRSGGSKLSNVRRFSILQSGEVLTSLNNDNSANFSGERKYNQEFLGVYFLIIREKL